MPGSTQVSAKCKGAISVSVITIHSHPAAGWAQGRCVLCEHEPPTSGTLLYSHRTRACCAVFRLQICSEGGRALLCARFRATVRVRGGDWQCTDNRNLALSSCSFHDDADCSRIAAMLLHLSMFSTVEYEYGGLHLRVQEVERIRHLGLG